MIERTAVIKNDRGFHLRTSMEFTKAMQGYDCHVRVIHGDMKFSGKSIIHLCGTHLQVGDEVMIQCDGPDEQEALAKAVEMIESGFGEAVDEKGEE